VAFCNLVGNERAKECLLSLLTQSKPPQTLLFSGQAGLGKRSFAIAFLQKLLGEKHAKRIQDETHPDVVWLKPEGKIQMHAVSSIKQMIEEAPLYSFEAKKKVYVIEEADRCLPSSSNALLKILEEPPEHVLFILLSSYEEGILPTILSRCVRIYFYPIAEEVLAASLEEKVGPVRARQIAFASQGSYSKAIKLCSEMEDPVRLQFLEIMRKFFLLEPSLDMLAALEALGKLLEKQEGEESMAQLLDTLFEDLLFWLRDLHYKSIDPKTEKLFHEKFSLDMDSYLDKRLPSLEKGFILVEKARFALGRNSRAKVVLEELFYNLYQQVTY
jgi:DNA polymerase III subunit delta'